MSNRKLTTKAEYRKLITQISRATTDAQYGDAFAGLLSAMRGPDSEDDGLKSRTTQFIRGALKWHCGLMNHEDPAYPVNWSGIELEAAHTHFGLHIRRAVKALRTFGIIPKKQRIVRVDWRRSK